jgi:phage-related protein
MGGIVETALKGITWVFEKIRDIISTVKNWLIYFIEPIVGNWLGINKDLINSANNTEVFGKAAGCKKEKSEIDKEYQKKQRTA